MTSPKVPPGAERVALGKKSEAKGKKEKEGFGAHKPGTHTQADYAQVSKVPSKKQSIQASTKTDGGHNA